MNKEVADKWVEALRSGKYRQITGRLKTEAGYCCLGVLCDVAENSGVELQVEKNEFGIFIYNESNTTDLPYQVVDWAGVNGIDPKVQFKDGKNMMSDLNDNYRLPFNEIADLIEEHWEEM